MLRTLRFLVALLLALAVPVQGMAAVSAGVCVAFGHHLEAAGQAGHAHEHDGSDAHDHAAHSHSHDETASAQEEHGGKAPHCGPCTACCASASIAGPVAHSIPASASEAPYIVSQSPPPGVQSGGLYRPPLAL